MSLKISDAFCYICRSVLIEPVTVPCLHVFCYTCFEQSMQETSYSCPLCRKRISNWVRTAKKTNNLINTVLWKKIKEQFEEQVVKKLRGEDDGLDASLQEECPTPTIVSAPGEVAQEFSKYINDFQSEEERLRKAEEEASNALISKLEEEDNKILEEIRKDNKVIAEQDEELARRIQEELNKATPSSSQSQPLVPAVKKISGPMDNFIKGNLRLRNGFNKISSENLPERSASAGSSDSIQSELHHFKPIKIVPRTPPKQRPDGKIFEINVTKVTPLKVLNKINTYEGFTNVNISKKIHSPYSAFIGKKMPCQNDNNHESPCKRLRFTDEPESGVLKEIILGENSDSNSQDDPKSQEKRRSPILLPKKSSSKNLPSDIFNFKNDSNENEEFETQDYLTPDLTKEEKLIEEQKRIEQLILQEKADRELALRLSREWGRKYELRTKPKPKPKPKQTPVKKATPFESKKVQQTLIDSLVSKRKTRK